MKRSDFIKEHVKLIKVLKSPSRKDDVVEAKEQATELTNVRKLKSRGMPGKKDKQK
jgi:hypothetical protein